ncbi:hypothetical protein OQA88_9728 [Cercophora sp. LCS_1]
MRLSALLPVALATTASAQDGTRRTSSYVDPATGITFQSFALTQGYRFGLVLPQQSDSKDLIVQLISPLNNGAGWAGIDFGKTMIGPLLLTAWPKGDSSNSVMISPRQATSYRADGCQPYTKGPIDIKPIAGGTFVNSTHVSATFVCGGCINSDSFDPTASATQEFAFAYSTRAVQNPSSDGAVLSPHNTNGELYGTFGVDIASAKSSSYGTFAAKAAEAAPSGSAGAGPTQTAPGGGSTPSSTAAPGAGPGTSAAGDLEYGRMSPGAIAALALVGVLYGLQALSIL